MNTLEEYVDGLFAGRKKTKEMRELRDEILSNLDAKICDRTQAGDDYQTAFDEATSGITSIDALIGSNRKIYLNRCVREASQVALLYCLIAWVLLMPLSFIRYGIILNYGVTLLLAGAAVLFILLLLRRDESFLKATAFVDVKKARRLGKIVWAVWGLLMLAVTLFKIGIHFASNIWFHRPVVIDGPYQFALLAADFALPFLSVLLPLFASKVCGLLRKYEVDDE